MYEEYPLADGEDGREGDEEDDPGFDDDEEIYDDQEGGPEYEDQEPEYGELEEAGVDRKRSMSYSAPGTALPVVQSRTSFNARPTSEYVLPVGPGDGRIPGLEPPLRSGVS